MSQLRKFALVSHVLPPSWSGQSVVLGRLFKDTDPESFILISNKKYDDENKISQNGVAVKYYYLRSLLNTFILSRLPGFRRFFYYFEVLYRSKQIARIVSQENCDCIVACSGDLIDIPAAYLAGLKNNKKVIPYYFDDYVFQWADTFSRKFAHKYEDLIFKINQTAIVPNEYMKDELFKRQKINASIVRNPVNPESESDKSKHSFLSNGIKIVYTGAIYHVNTAAFRTLLTCLKTINEINIEVHLYTAQPVEFLLKEGISGNNIQLHSHASETETALAQQQASILLIPFTFNSTVPEVIRTSAPGKLADYLASGVPILAFVPPDSFVAWFLKRHQCGMVIEEDNPIALAKGITKLLSDPQLREMIINNGLKLVREEFSVKKACEEFMNTISRTIDNS